MGKLRLLRAVALLVAFVAVGVLAPATAHAAEPAGLEHCAVFLDSGRTVCVARGDDLPAAVLRETGLVMVDSTVEARSGVSPAATYVMAVLYDEANFVGPFLSLLWSSPCSSGYVGWSDIGWANHGR